jgi:hypothetical protein
MKHKIIILILLVLFLAGCRSGSINEEGDVNFRTGTRGLEIKYLDRSPPFYVYEGDYLPITLELFNRGASEIFEGEIYITGYDPNIIHNNPASGVPGNLPTPGTPIKFEMLDKKTQFNREGGYLIMELNSGKINLPYGTHKYNIPLTVYACYDYETIANTEICMDPEPHRQYYDKPCVTTNVNMGGGQGAPVGVGNVELTNMRDQMRITFTINNVGSGFGAGTIVDLDKMRQNACPTGFGPTDIDVIYLSEVKVGTNTITQWCSPNGRIKLVNGVGRVSCTAPMPAGTAFKTPLEIRFEYGYRTHIRRDVEIRGYY